MLSQELKSITSSPRELKKFGLTMAAALAIIGGLLLWRHKDYYLYFFVLSALFLPAGFFTPAILKPVHKLWMSSAVIMGWFVTRLILVTLFYFVLTPTALLLRILGKDILDLKLKKGPAESYWIPRPAPSNGPAGRKQDYEKQF
jgi:hypothetical protein